MASIIEIQTDLQKLTNRKITYTDIGNILGTGRANISTRAKNNSQVTPKEISLLENAYNVSLSDIKHIKQYKYDNYNSVTLDYYPDVFGIGLTAAKKAIKDLINEGLIIKSKRSKVQGNYNKYLITPKVQNLTSERAQNECFKKSDSDLLLGGTGLCI